MFGKIGARRTRSLDEQNIHVYRANIRVLDHDLAVGHTTRTGASGVSNSQIMIQNADIGSINVDVLLVKGSGSPGANFTKHITNLAQGGTFYYDLDDESSVNVADGWFGAGVVTGLSGKKIVVISNLFSGPNSLQTYNAFPAGKLAADWFVPLFTSRLSNGLSTPVSVQNLTGGSVGVGLITLTCTKDPASPGANFSKSNTAAVGINE